MDKQEILSRLDQAMTVESQCHITPVGPAGQFVKMVSELRKELEAEAEAEAERDANETAALGPDDPVRERFLEAEHEQLKNEAIEGMTRVEIKGKATIGSGIYIESYYDNIGVLGVIQKSPEPLSKQQLIRRSLDDAQAVYRKAMELVVRCDGGYTVDNDVPADLLHAAMRALEFTGNMAKEITD